MMLSVHIHYRATEQSGNELIAFARDMQDARLSMNRLSDVRDKRMKKIHVRTDTGNPERKRNKTPEP